MYFFSGYWLIRMVKAVLRIKSSGYRPGDEMPLVQERYPWESRTFYCLKIMFKLGFIVFAVVLVAGTVLLQNLIGLYGQEFADIFIRLWIIGMVLGIAMVVIGFFGIIFYMAKKNKRNQ